ncbi:MAG: DNA polymerase III subunit gamma/tau [Patulibacter sp.]
MSAPSLYRRHRPRTFDDVVGQDHVVRTLRNAVEQGKVHHAYLFVGSRGTGKTSLSKILAACLDCEHGPTVAPCGTCESCLAIQRATSLDVVEMDAASNNSVDDVRELRERVATAPTGGRWRVYILDEAHMLTTQAWNALLKTLEEPPPQTVFVLATTEAHKVPATVVDRCHRFDFTRPTGAQISRVLARVAEREGLTMGEGAVALVARHANGSFRDALGTLEQLVTYAGTTVTEQDAVTVLGIGDDAQLFRAVDAVIAGSAPDALRVVQEVASHGRDLGSYARELERHARDLLVCCILGGVPAEVQLTADRDALLDDQARRIGRDQATRLLELLAEAMTAARDGADQRAMLELALVKAADPTVDPALRAVQARLARLEAQLAGGADRGRSADGGANGGAGTSTRAADAATALDRPAGTRAHPEPQPLSEAEDADVGAVAPPHEPGPPAVVEPQPSHPPVSDGAPPAAASRAGVVPPAGGDVPPFDGPQLREVPLPQAPAGPALVQHLPPELHAVPEPQVPQVPAEVAPVEVPSEAREFARPPVAPEAPAGGGPTLAELVAVWGGVLDNLSGRDHLCAVALERARPVAVEDGELTLAFPTDAAFYRGTADREERRVALREALKEVTGVALTLRFELRDLTDAPPSAVTPTAAPGAQSLAGPPGAPSPPPAAAAPPAPAEQADLPPSRSPAGEPPVASPGAAAPPVQPLARRSGDETLDEHAAVAHLVTELGAEELGDQGPEPA